MVCKGADLTFLLGSVDTGLSAVWLPPVTPDAADRITTRHAVSGYLFPANRTGTQPGISCEVQHVIILPCFFLTLGLNQ